MRLLIEGIRKGYLFSEKCHIKGKGLDFLDFFVLILVCMDIFKRFGLYKMFLLLPSLSII